MGVKSVEPAATRGVACRDVERREEDKSQGRRGSASKQGSGSMVVVVHKVPPRLLYLCLPLAGDSASVHTHRRTEASSLLSFRAQEPSLLDAGPRDGCTCKGACIHTNRPIRRTGSGVSLSEPSFLCSHRCVLLQVDGLAGEQIPPHLPACRGSVLCGSNASEDKVSSPYVSTRRPASHSLAPSTCGTLVRCRNGMANHSQAPPREG